MNIQASTPSKSQSVNNEHFDPKGKMPSSLTIALQNGLRQSLPFGDQRDFEEVKKGFIAAPPYKRSPDSAAVPPLQTTIFLNSFEFLSESTYRFNLPARS